MEDSVKVAMLAGALVFVLIVLIPIASFLLKAAIVALLAGLGVFVVLRLLGR
ncbi:MAG: hypothetical protein AAFR47_00315 [Pseudomonadota bacterium]